MTTSVYGFTATQSMHEKANCTAVKKVKVKNLKEKNMLHLDSVMMLGISL